MEPRLKKTSREVIEMITKLDIMMALVMDKLGVTQEEFKAYIDKRTAEFLAAQNKETVIDDL